jgi:hypothetical protein
MLRFAAHIRNENAPAVRNYLTHPFPGRFADAPRAVIERRLDVRK